jgi:hypothetical protein
LKYIYFFCLQVFKFWRYEIYIVLNYGFYKEGGGVPRGVNFIWIMLNEEGGCQRGIIDTLPPSPLYICICGFWNIYIFFVFKSSNFEDMKYI